MNVLRSRGIGLVTALLGIRPRLHFVLIDTASVSGFPWSFQVTIDMNLPENQNPVQVLEDGEDIDVMYIPINKLVPTLKAFDAKGYSVFMGLYSLAMALNMGSKF